MDEIECVVIGAGVVELAVARALAMQGREVVIVEKESLFGSETSSRNSEVIHAGIYYPAGSSKARLYVEGRKQLYAYCDSRNVAYNTCGKRIVAPKQSQVVELETVAAAAAARNGVDDIAWLDRAAALSLDPELQCDAASLSPSTGNIDSHGLMLAYLGDAEARGAVLALSTRVARIESSPHGATIGFNGEEPSLRVRLLINCVGLAAPDLARSAGVDAPTAYYAKGNYYALSGRSPFSRFIYPTPEPGGLSVHITLDLAGQARFGPDVEWDDAPHYDVDPKRVDKFYATARAYWPGLRDGQLTPGAANADFMIVAATADLQMINLYGIESPGPTASLAIADEVATLSREVLDA